MSGLNRYTRQITLPEIGEEGQKKISAASVLMIGAGGLGCPALMYLVAAGVGKIGIADFDTIDESNLHRQVVYTQNDIGKSKAATAAQKLKSQNPEAQIEIFEEGLTADNAEDLFSNYDLIIDGTDNFDTKFLINDAAIKFNKSWIYGAINKFEGHVAVFNGDVCYRCLFPEKPKERILNCAEAGVLGATVGIVGAMQAMEAIKFIVGLPTLTNKLWTIDTLTMQTRTLDIVKDPSCKISSDPSTIILAPPPNLSRAGGGMCRVGEAKPSLIPKLGGGEITIAEAMQIDDAIWIDVREEYELLAGFVPDAINLPLSYLLEGRPADLPKNKPLVVYCQKGFRSLDASAILKARGYETLWSLKGGYSAWLASARAA